MMLSAFSFLLLSIAIGSILLYQRVSDELWRVLAAGTAMVCLIWGFAIAHWSVQLLGLVALLKFKDLPAIFSIGSSQ